MSISWPDRIAWQWSIRRWARRRPVSGKQKRSGTHMQHNSTNLRLRTLTILTGVACATIAMAASAKDAGRGRDTFEKRCTGCHALDKNKVGPPLRGVYGRSAGKDPRFLYSDAVKNASVMWDESTLDRWLTDTE